MTETNALVGKPTERGALRMPIQKSLFSYSSTATDRDAHETAKAILGREGIAVVFINDPDQAAAAIARLMQEESPLGLDTETAKLPEYIAHKQAGLDPHLSRIRLIQLYGGSQKVYVFDMFALDMEMLRSIWDKPLVAHNAIFDLKHLFHAGAHPHQVGCTMLINNALTGELSSLAALARRHSGWNISKEQRVSDWNQQPLTPEQLSYAALDSVAVFKLYRTLRDELSKRNLVPVYKLMRDAQRTIAQMELNGIYFDLQDHEKLMTTWQHMKTEAEKRLLDILGPHINPDSGKQISDWLANNLDRKALRTWPRTKTGQLRTDGNSLSRFPEHPIVKSLLAYKEATKMLSTFGAGYADHVNPKTGRIHASFKLGGTSTGRLSCSNPNIQNPPRDKAFRALFSAAPGRKMVVADYGQIELRVAALVSGDKNMIEAYRKAQDLHRKTAAAIAKVSLEQVTKTQRQAAKAVNFGLLYGQGPRGLARYAKAGYGVSMSEKEAEEAREAFFRAYPGLKQWQVEAGRRAEKEMRAITPGGRIRDFTKEPGGYRFTEALNTPIQGGAAEVMMTTLACLERHLEGIDAKLVNVVHDEIVLEVAEKNTERAEEAIEKAMIEGMLAVFPNAGTAALVEARSGENWAEAK